MSRMVPGSKRSLALARGCPYRRGLRLVIDTDEDTMAQIRTMAAGRRMTVAATVRMLIEWGLMAEEDGRG